MKKGLLTALAGSALVMACASSSTTEEVALREVNLKKADEVTACEFVVSSHGFGDHEAEGLKSAMINAVKDAQKRAGGLSKGDTVVITKNELVVGKRMFMDFYDCSMVPEEKSIKSVKQGEVELDVFEKAKKCQDKGGVWLNDQCVIQID